MEVVHRRDIVPEPSTDPIFAGNVSTRMLLDAPDGRLRFNLVHFEAGGRTHWHTHSFEQALLITEGRGILATEAHEHVVEAGDIVVVPPLEKHWHGGTETSAMTHVAILQAGATTILEPVERIRTRDA